MPLHRLLVSHEQVVVAAIRFPGYVGEISNHGYGAKGIFDRKVEHHAQYGNARSPPFPCGKNNEKRGNRRECITDSGNPANESIQSESNPGAWNFKAIIKPSRDEIELLIGGRLTDGRTFRDGRKDFATNVGRLWHGETIRRPGTASGCSPTDRASCRSYPFPIFRCAHLSQVAPFRAELFFRRREESRGAAIRMMRARSLRPLK